MKLILVRHGETTSNVTKSLDTKLPGAGLTERGIAQAKAFGARLASPPRVLVASQALRAQQTAAEISAATGVPVTVRPGLHEVQMGDRECRNDEESHQMFVDVFHCWHAGDLGVRMPGGESGREVLDRFLPVVRELREEYLDSEDSDGEVSAGDVLVVSHGAAIRLVARHLTGLPWQFAADTHLDNTETAELSLTPNGDWQCLRWGSVKPPFPTEGAGADIPMG